MRARPGDWCDRAPSRKRRVYCKKNVLCSSCVLAISSLQSKMVASQSIKANAKDKAIEDAQDARMRKRGFRSVAAWSSLPARAGALDEQRLLHLDSRQPVPCARDGPLKVRVIKGRSEVCSRGTGRGRVPEGAFPLLNRGPLNEVGISSCRNVSKTDGLLGQCDGAVLALLALAGCEDATEQRGSPDISLAGGGGRGGRDAHADGDRHGSGWSVDISHGLRWPAAFPSLARCNWRDERSDFRRVVKIRPHWTLPLRRWTAMRVKRVADVGNRQRTLGFSHNDCDTSVLPCGKAWHSGFALPVPVSAFLERIASTCAVVSWVDHSPCNSWKG
ncbi:hypothetical protein U1Q18_051446 [Sarracenia purpurea var. burkii]